MNAISEDRYFLSKHAHICVLGNRVILLDVISGKYLSLEAGKAAALRSRVHGWPELQARNENTGALESLLKQGLLTNDRASGKSADPVAVEPPVQWLAEFRPRGRPEIGAVHAWRFFKAAWSAMFGLRALQLRTVVRRVSERKATAAGTNMLDEASVTELVRVFEWLRPLAFEKKNACFLYCLAMANFLAEYNVFPDWIFAVKDQPFAAHCWLQQNGRLFTDIPFKVRELTPIMVV